MSESIIGWDIGIKNMACCKLVKLDQSDTVSNNIIQINNNKYHIQNWEVINIVPKVAEIQKQNSGEIMLSSRPNIVCGSRMNNGNNCNKKAVACDIDGGKGYCTVHFKKLTPPETVPIKSNTCKCRTCDSKASYVLADNLYVGYCRPHRNLMQKQLGDTAPATLKLVKNKKTTSLNLTSLAEALYQELDQRDYLMIAKTVLLENQPVLKNPTMKTMQIFLYGYYVQNGIRKSGVSEINCYSASKKLDLIKLLPTDKVKKIVEELKTIKGQYSRNKRMAVRMCEYLLDTGINATNIKQLFSDKKKQDDLADSLLMTLHYQEKANLAKLGNKTNTTMSKEDLAFISELLSSLEEPKDQEASLEVPIIESD